MPENTAAVVGAVCLFVVVVNDPVAPLILPVAVIVVDDECLSH